MPDPSTGYLDTARQAEWEAKLPGDVRKDWSEFVKWLRSIGPEYRARIVSVCMDADLGVGREAYTEAYKASERFKADLVRRNAMDTRGIAEGRLATSVRRATDALTTWRAVGMAALRAVQQAGSDLQVYELCRGRLLKVSATWPEGLEYRPVVTSGDVPVPVQEARQQAEVKTAVQVTVPQDDAVLAAQEPARVERMAEEAAVKVLQDKAEEAEKVLAGARKKKTKEPAPGQSLLFGGGS